MSLSPSMSGSFSDTSSSSYYSSSTSTSFNTDYSLDSSDMGTPVKKRSFARSANTAPSMKKGLKTDFSGHMYQEVSVEDFLINIWGLDSATVKTILDSEIRRPSAALQEYWDVLNLKNYQEFQLHQPFCDISDQLLLEVCALLGLESSVITTGFWDGGGTKVIKSDYTHRKPDLMRVWLPLLAKMKWDLSKAPLEFKRHFKETVTKLKATSNPALLPVDENEEFQVVPPSNLGSAAAVETLHQSHHSAKAATSDAPAKAKKASATSKSKRGRGPKSHRLLNENIATSSQTNSLPTQPHSGHKRSHEEVEGSNGLSASKRRKTDGKMTNDQLQLATYALECLGCLGRYYVTGIFVDQSNISIWYFDRVAVIRTVDFNLEEPDGVKYLALCLFALDQCNMQQAGFDPHVYRFTPPADSTMPITESCIQALDRAAALEDDKLCFRFPKASDDQPDYVFELLEVLFTYRAIVGRGTLVAAIRVYILDECLYRDHYAIKLSWQYRGRKPEGEILSSLRKALPYWKRHLPDPLFSAKYTPEELGIPRSRMDLKEPEGTEKIQDRDLHVLASQKYAKLWEAESIEEFMRAFLDCLECHYHVYHTGRVLHRDISENNLMIWRPVDELKAEPKDDDLSLDATIENASKERKDTESLGVLNDFDMAAEVGDDGELLVSAAHHRTGTLPFMARDLLKPVPSGEPTPKHLYRHDLESFFYILVWAAIHYEIATKTRHSTPKSLKSWLLEDYAHDSKTSFVLNYARYVEIRSHRRPEYNDLWQKWIEPLRILLWRAETDAEAHLINGTSFDYDTYNGKITFHSFMAAMGETPRDLEVEVLKEEP